MTTETKESTQVRDLRNGTITTVSTVEGWTIHGVSKILTAFGEAQEFHAEIKRCAEDDLLKDGQWRMPHKACDIEHRMAPDRKHMQELCHGWHVDRVRHMLVSLERTYK